MGHQGDERNRVSDYKAQKCYRHNTQINLCNNFVNLLNLQYYKQESSVITKWFFKLLLLKIQLIVTWFLVLKKIIKILIYIFSRSSN